MLNGRPHIKNLIAQQMLIFARENRNVNGSVSIDDIFYILENIKFDDLIDEEKEIFEKEGIKTDKELWEQLGDEDKYCIVLDVIRNMFKDSLCYFHNNTLVFPGAFKYKAKKEDKGFLKNDINIVAQTNNEYTVSTVITYLFYSGKYKIIKHLQDGVILKDERDKEYFVEFDINEDEKLHSYITNIRIYVKNRENEADLLADFIISVLKEKLEVLYDVMEYEIFKNNRNIGEARFFVRSDENFELKCNELVFKQKIKRNEYDEREILKVDELKDKSFEEFKRKFKNILNLEREFVFVHLSDIHFNEKTDVEREFCIIKKILDKYKNKRMYLVVSGDLSIKADMREFENAAFFIEKIINEYDITPNRLVVVPGNHDYDRKVTQSAYNVERYVKERFDESKDFKVNDFVMLKRDDEKWNRKFDNFSDFIYQRFYHKKYNYKGFNFIDDYEFWFVMLNTSRKIDQFFIDNVDFDIQFLVECECNKPKIAIGHHPSNWAKQKEKEEMFLQTLNDNDFYIYFHGHIHRSTMVVNRNYTFRKNSTVHIGAGLFWAYDVKAMVPGVPMRFNIVEVDKNENRIERLKIKSFERERNLQDWSESYVFYRDGKKVPELEINF
ncbi:metallophosphoesterase family protein [Caminibacter sp.]